MSCDSEDMLPMSNEEIDKVCKALEEPVKDESNPEYNGKYPHSLIKKVWDFLKVGANIDYLRKLSKDNNLISIHIIGGGMDIRNFLRDQGECKDWNCHDLDNNWIDITECVLNYDDIIKMKSDADATYLDYLKK